MPKIDTATIEGFADMTADEQVAALLNIEVPEAVNLGDYVKKSVFDAKASEAASLSKKLQGYMSDEDKAKDAMQSEIDALKQRYADLETVHNATLKENRIAQYKAQYVAQGFEEALAAETAKALEAGEMDKVFANTKKFAESLSAKIKADIMKNDPHPDGSGGSKDGEDAAITRAKEIGKEKAAERSATAEVMKHYI